jgi:tRNA G18 (ribose-2'-O)-methylase SpoU
MKKPIAVYGKNPFLEALRLMPEGVIQVFLEEKLHDEDIWRAIKAANLIPKELSRKTADYLVGDAVHQGVVVEFDASHLLYRLDALPFVQSPTPDTCLVVLGELTDPQNVGAIHDLDFEHPKRFSGREGDFCQTFF